MRGIHDGDLLIDDRFAGMLNGTATIPSGASARITGMVNGDVIVEPGAAVRIAGMVNGTVIDRGGQVEVTGMVDAIVRG